MKLTLAAGALLLALSFPAFAQDKPVCGFYFDEVVANIQADIAGGAKATLVIVEGDKLPAFMTALNKGLGTNIEGVTRAIVVAGVNIVVGLEIGGCLSDPIIVDFPLPAKMSGRMPDGKTYA